MSLNANNSSSFTYWPINNGGYTSGGSQYGWSSGTINTITVTTTGSGTTNPFDVPTIPDFKESEVGRLRRSVADLCVEGRLALEAA